MPLSRRHFLGAAAGFSLQWGGLRLVAGAQQSSFPSDPGFLYGSAFYRPPNPPREMRRGMLEAIAHEHQFNIIRIYPGWDYYNPKPGVFAFDDVDEILGWCDELGIRILLGAVLESAPWWLEQAHPETRYVDAKGAASRLQGSANNMTGGWPGLCWDWAPVREAAGEYLRALARMASQHRSMYAYDCWNEIHIEPAWPRNIWAQPQELLFCYCPQTIAAFHRWLEKKYGGLDQLNAAWFRRYPNWEAIDPPRAHGTYVDWVDWRRFILERSTAELQYRVSMLRQEDKNSIVEDHMAHHPPFDGVALGGADPWRLAEQVQTWGLSLFPRWFAMQAYEGAARLDITRSVAAGKDFWMTELQGGHGNNGLFRSHKMRERDIRFWNWMAVAYGARGLVYWTYHSEATGREATGFGLVDRNGQPTERVREAALNCRLIREHWDALKQYQPKPRVGIVADNDNALLLYAMEGNESASTESFRGYMKAIWQLDLMADFLEPAGLDRSTHDVLIVPWHLIGKKETCAALLRAAERGATVILETSFGLFSEGFVVNRVVPPHGLAEALGYQEGESFYLNTTSPLAQASARPSTGPVSPSDRIYDKPAITFDRPAAVQLTGHTFVTPITLTSAEAIGRCEDFTVACRKKVGKGIVYYIGTNLGASITAGDDGGIEFLRTILHQRVTPAVRAVKLRPRLIEAGGKRILALFNDTVEDHTEILTMPGGVGRATDIHSGKEYLVSEGRLTVTVPYQDVVVLLLS